MARRPGLALPALLACALPTSVLLAAPAAAAPREDAGTGTATVGLASDAWYATSPACTTSPTGCLPAAAPNTYPAKTLHVGVTAGVEDARSYLSLDLGALPAATRLAGGSLRIPVGSSEDGTRSPEAADLQACLVTAAFKDDAEGAAEAPPAVDCKKGTSPATYAAPTGPAPAAFSVDLAPFAAAWAEGAANHGIALLPAADAAPTDSWHVAFSAHDRRVNALMRVTATVTFASASSVDTGSSFDAPAASDAPPAAPTDSFGSSSVSFAAPPLAPAASLDLPTAQAPVAPAPQAQGVPAAPATQLQPQAFSLPSRGYAYPGVFLLPLLLAGAGGWLARALTRDLTPRTPVTA